MDPAAIEPPKVTNISIRASRGYLGWLNRLARHCRSTIAGEFDRAIVAHARAVGFDESPPSRYPATEPTPPEPTKVN